MDRDKLKLITVKFPHDLFDSARAKFGERGISARLRWLLARDLGLDPERYGPLPIGRPVTDSAPPKRKRVKPGKRPLRKAV